MQSGKNYIFLAFVFLFASDLCADDKMTFKQCAIEMRELGVSVITTKNGPEIVYQQHSLPGARPGEPIFRSAPELNNPPVPYVTEDRLLWFSVSQLPAGLALRHGEIPISVGPGGPEINAVDNHLKIEEKWTFKNGQVFGMSTFLFIEGQLLGSIYFDSEGRFKSGFRNQDFPDKLIDLYFENPKSVRSLLADGYTSSSQLEAGVIYGTATARQIPLEAHAAEDARALLSKGLFIPRHHPSFEGTRESPIVSEVRILREVVRSAEQTSVINVRATHSWTGADGLERPIIQSREAKPVQENAPEVIVQGGRVTDPTDFNRQQTFRPSSSRVAPSRRAELILETEAVPRPGPFHKPRKRIFMEVRRDRQNPDWLWLEFFEATETESYRPESFDPNTENQNIEVQTNWEYRRVGSSSTFLDGHFSPQFVQWTPDFIGENEDSNRLGSIYDLLQNRFRSPLALPVQENEGSDFLNWETTRLPAGSKLLEASSPPLPSSNLWMYTRSLPNNQVIIEVYQDDLVDLYSINDPSQHQSFREVKKIGESRPFVRGQEMPSIFWDLPNSDQDAGPGEISRSQHIEDLINERLQTEHPPLRIAR